LALEKRKIALKEEQVRADIEGREAAGRRRNEERKIERLRQVENESLIAKI